MRVTNRSNAVTGRILDPDGVAPHPPAGGPQAPFRALLPAHIDPSVDRVPLRHQVVTAVHAVQGGGDQVAAVVSAGGRHVADLALARPPVGGEVDQVGGFGAFGAAQAVVRYSASLVWKVALARR
ncbi:hypothetical protein GCM10022214_24610 [Actinomadura miaoliensis]|uniref:Uncharacterized protein n=1 Tax=Actinomadura miaoliensis TaxID=430685 RepID=A0ABP7VJR1_9ACTN